MRGGVSWDRLNDALLALGEKDGVVPLNRLPGFYYRRVDRRWRFWLNGQPLRRRVRCRKGLSLYPGELYIEFNGWPFGVLDCATGEGFAGAGDVANLAAFVAALQEASK